MYVPIGQRGEFRLVLLTFRDVNTSLGLGIVYSAHIIISRLLFRYHCQYFTATFAASTLRYTNVLEAFVKGCDARYLPCDDRSLTFAGVTECVLTTLFFQVLSRALQLETIRHFPMLTA